MPVIIALGPITARVSLAINWTEINMAALVCTCEHCLHVCMLSEWGQVCE